MATNATAVSRALSAAGEQRSVLTMSSMVKGYGTASPGFRAQNVNKLESRKDYRRLHRGKDAPWGYVNVPHNVPTGEVTVEYTSGSWGTHDEAVEREHLARYVEILTAKGFTAEIKTDPFNDRRRVHVTKGE